MNSGLFKNVIYKMCLKSCIWYIHKKDLALKDQQWVIGDQTILIRGSLNKFPDFFRMGTFIDSTHMKL